MSRGLNPPDSSREETRELRVSVLLPFPDEAKLWMVLLTASCEGWLLFYLVPSAILKPPCNLIISY